MPGDGSAVACLAPGCLFPAGVVHLLCRRDVLRPADP